MTQGAAQISYSLNYNNSSWGSYLVGGNKNPPPLGVVLDGTGNGSLSQIINGTIRNGQSSALSGTFISTFSGLDAATDYGYASSFKCGASLSSRAVSTPFVVRTTNKSSCTLNTTDLDFGTQSNLSNAIDATNTIRITCTTGTAYTVGLGNGTSGATSPAARKMTNLATTDAVTYGIYLNIGRTQAWGNGSSGSLSSAIGNGASQSFIGYGRIPVQNSPAALNYTDVVVVTITY